MIDYRDKFVGPDPSHQTVYGPGVSRKLFQTAQQLVVPGNPTEGVIDPLTGLSSLHRNRTPDGREIAVVNPDVTSGGGGNPKPMGFADGGIDARGAVGYNPGGAPIARNLAQTAIVLTPNNAPRLQGVGQGLPGAGNNANIPYGSGCPIIGCYSNPPKLGGSQGAVSDPAYVKGNGSGSGGGSHDTIDPSKVGGG